MNCPLGLHHQPVSVVQKVLNVLLSLVGLGVLQLLHDFVTQSLPHSGLHTFTHLVLLLLLVCVSFTIIGQPRNSVLIRRV